MNRPDEIAALSNGMTCYERDEDLCEDQMCLRTGCRLRNTRLSATSPGDAVREACAKIADEKAKVWQEWNNISQAFAAEHIALSIRNLDLAAEKAGDELVSYFERQIEWSRQTFGPALRTKGVIDHIRKELREIEASPHDLSEWVDVIILAMDGFWRHGGEATALLPALLAKQQKNMARTWPDWRSMSEDGAIEHDRTKDAATPTPPSADVEQEIESAQGTLNAYQDAMASQEKNMSDAKLIVMANYGDLCASHLKRLLKLIQSAAPGGGTEGGVA